MRFYGRLAMGDGCNDPLHRARYDVIKMLLKNRTLSKLLLISFFGSHDSSSHKFLETSSRQSHF
jgi:hypothetical protein